MTGSIWVDLGRRECARYWAIAGCEHPTTNNQHPTAATGVSTGCWVLDVGCWMFPIDNFHAPGSASSLRPDSYAWAKLAQPVCQDATVPGNGPHTWRRQGGSLWLSTLIHKSA